jgi:hypothetical protein
MFPITDLKKVKNEPLVFDVISSSKKSIEATSMDYFNAWDSTIFYSNRGMVKYMVENVDRVKSKLAKFPFEDFAGK